MSSSIADILGNQRFEEPPEIMAIKDFVMQQFGHTPNVRITNQAIMITVSSAALAGALRPHLFQLQHDIQTTKRLVIRIA